MNVTMRPIFGIIFAVLIVAHFCSAATAQQKYVHEFHHDFRGKPLPKELQVVGKPEPDFLKEEKEGFRITLPNTFIHPHGGIGCRTTFGLKGDFEVTGAYEILQADIPAKGYGVGCSIYINGGGEDPFHASVARVVRGGGKQIVLWELFSQKLNKGVGADLRPCTEKVVRLRLKRIGKTLHYSWAPGLAGDNFEELRAEPKYGDNEVTAVRMNTITGKEPCNVDVRFLELHVGSGGVLENKNAAPLPPPANPENAPIAEATGGGSWVMVFVIIGGVMLSLFAIAAVSAVLVFTRRSKPAVAASKDELVNFFCSACGKSLKAKSSAAGKKIKCAKCGKAVLVPE